ncbi:MAG: hypothetical protein ACTHMQ_04190 [Protaetiibacter sp.]
MHEASDDRIGWDPREAFVTWAPDDAQRQVSAAVRAFTDAEFFEDLNSNVVAVVLDVLGLVGDRTAPMAEVERVARMPRDRARLVFEQAGNMMIRWLLDDVPAAEVAGVAESLAWMALLARGEEVPRA